MKKILFAASVLLFLSACAVTPQTPEQAVYVINGDFIAALDVVDSYKKLPACGSIGATAVCSQPAVVAKLVSSANCAASVLAVAQSKVRGVAVSVNTQCADSNVAATVGSISALDVSGVIALAKQTVASLTALTDTLKH